MGRGRAKAKQAKVARELKYFSPETDFTALQRELTSTGESDHPYADYADNDTDECQASWSSFRH
ncbi:DUF3073 domain-containing protein [Plantactinospora sp. CA-290183]|uniref:DUF3073 domain-containing protein n=1 Tax=Plantactinospora sp. CA-290183 TaxID=3240006 RepID=UPI003D8EAB7B